MISQSYNKICSKRKLHSCYILIIIIVIVTLLNSKQYDYATNLLAITKIGNFNIYQLPSYLTSKFVSLIDSGLQNKQVNNFRSTTVNNTNSSIPIKYISFCQGVFNTRRTGNQLFVLAALLLTAIKSGRVPLLPKVIPENNWADTFFDINIQRDTESKILHYSNLTINERFNSFTYDPSFASLSSNQALSKSETILICGYFNSYKYLKGIERQFTDIIRVKEGIKKAVGSYMTKSFIEYVKELNKRKDSNRNRSKGGNNNFVEDLSAYKEMVSIKTIGIHIRRGDFEQHTRSLTSAYFFNAISYFVDHFRRMNFLIENLNREIKTRKNSKNDSKEELLVKSKESLPLYKDDMTLSLLIHVCSDNIGWSKNTLNKINLHMFNNTNIKFLYSEGHDPGFDMTLLSLTDAVILTLTTFGWWAGWLSNKPVVFWAGFPERGDLWGKGFNAEDFYPPHWIGLY